MERKAIIKGFVQLGELMTVLGNNKPWPGYSVGITEEEFQELEGVINKEVSHNGWFTPENVRKSLASLGEILVEEELKSWVESYSYSKDPKRIAIIMAGNIPLVGFHDFLSVLISGNKAVCKLSSDDKNLLPALAEHLIAFVPELKDRIEFSLGKISDMDAVIATGSDNSLKYFEQYFGKYPHIFRKNRTSIAVLKGGESEEELKRLGEDVFSYFGLGCRNVSHLLVPENFNLDRFFEAIVEFGDVVHNNKYGNNYDYNKAVYLLNNHKLLDNNFVLLRETTDLFSPLAMIHYHYYKSEEEVNQFIEAHDEEVQVVLGDDFVPFGASQKPGLCDYADGVDTMKWLNSI